MSTLRVANVQSTNATSNLVLRTGNTSGAFVALNPNSTGIVFFSNSSSSFLTVNSTFSSNNEISNTGNTTATGIVIFSGNVTPALIAANTVDWAPPVANTFMVRVSANNNANLTEYSIFGMTGGVNGQIITLSNIGPTKIILRNDDAGNSTINQANASNRFLLPNHMAIGGYQSVQLIYDGTNARWRPLSSLRLAYTHKSVLDKGFWGGGFVSPSYRTTVEKITYSTEVKQTTFANTMSTGRGNISGAGNSDKGFLSGGYGDPAFSVVTDKVTYTTEAVAAASGANLSQAREGPGAAGNSDKGIFAGGATTVGSATPVTTAGRTTYSTETHAAVSGANLSQARALLAAAGNSDKGFFAGGFISPAVAATTGRTTYSTETHAAVSGANLSQSRRSSASAGNSDKGFFAGGDTPTNVTTADRTTYATETTAAVTGANLSQARTTLGGAGNGDKGFFAGGQTPAAVATADRTTYASETTAAVTGANLGTARHGLGAV
jgi:hypothetical protein